MMHDVTANILASRRSHLLSKQRRLQHDHDEAVATMNASQTDLETVSAELAAIDADLVAAGRDPQALTEPFANA